MSNYSKETEHLFIALLEDEGVMEEFKLNTGVSMDSFFTAMSMGNVKETGLITGAFNWGQDHKKWGRISERWRSMLKKHETPIDDHYSAYVQPIDLIMAQKLNFNLGNIVKYASRADKKGQKRSDLLKVIDYALYELNTSEPEVEIAKSVKEMLKKHFDRPL